MWDFVTFKRYVTPLAIQVIFGVGVVVSVILGVTMIAASRGAAASVIVGLVWMFVGPIAVRVFCELFMVMFGILERLDEIKERLGRPD